MQRRMLHLSIWSSEQVGDLSHGARLLYIGLITLADDVGRFRIHPAFLKAQVFPYDEAITGGDINGFVDEIVKRGLIKVYVVDGQKYGVHPKWTEYQTIRKDLFKDSKLPSPEGDTGDLQASNEPVTDTLRDSNEVETEPVQTRTLSKDNISKDNINKTKTKGIAANAATSTKYPNSKQFQQSYEFFTEEEKQGTVLKLLVGNGLNEQYAKRELRDFVNYWTAELKSGKQRWEAEKTFMLNGRLATWFKKANVGFGNKLANPSTNKKGITI